MKFAIFFDYDNLLPIQKTQGILNIATKALIQAPLNFPIARGTCDIRVYGGWYEGINMSPLAQEVAVAIQKDFPAIIRLPRNGGIAALATNAELAVALLEEPGHHLFNTYRKKGKPNNIHIQSPRMVGCLENSCPLPNARKLLKTGRCPMNTCACTADDLVYRNEQKIVDTMLTCDLIYATNLSYDYVILISSDDDFLPPIRTVLLRGTAVIRIHPKANGRSNFFTTGGTRFFEMEL